MDIVVDGISGNQETLTLGTCNAVAPSAIIVVGERTGLFEQRHHVV